MTQAQAEATLDTPHFDQEIPQLANQYRTGEAILDLTFCRCYVSLLEGLWDVIQMVCKLVNWFETIY